MAPYARLHGNSANQRRGLVEALGAFALATALVTTACLGSVPAPEVDIDGVWDDEQADKASVLGIEEGSAQAMGILAVANHPDLAHLAAAGLARRPIDNIKAFRAGVDGQLATADDVAFASLAQLDKVPYVGVKVFGALLAYATDQGLVPAAGAGLPDSAGAARVGWSGYFWSMADAELALGWNGEYERRTWSAAQARAFVACVDSYSQACVALLDEMAANKGRGLSPLMKFDLYVRRKLEAAYGAGGAPASAYTKATQWELDNHYIGDDDTHRYWAARDYAGKCIGWSLANFDWAEPTMRRQFYGIEFTPADIKGYLASIYNGAQFFIPEDMVMGREYHDVEGSDTPAIYADVLPAPFLRALSQTIARGGMLEADLDPGDEVWNYPIHGYELSYTKVGAKKVRGTVRLEHASDTVPIDLVSAEDPGRGDLEARELAFELTFAAPFTGDLLAETTSSQWIDGAEHRHPDVVIMGIEPGWRQAIYDYANTDMKREVNFPLIKRERVNGTWVPIVDGLLAAYYAP